MECKTPAGKVRAEQAEFLSLVRRVGGVAFVARTCRDVLRKLPAIGERSTSRGDAPATLSDGAKIGDGKSVSVACLERQELHRTMPLATVSMQCAPLSHAWLLSGIHLSWRENCGHRTAQCLRQATRRCLERWLSVYCVTACHHQHRPGQAPGFCVCHVLAAWRLRPNSACPHLLTRRLPDGQKAKSPTL